MQNLLNILSNISSDEFLLFIFLNSSRILFISIIIISSGELFCKSVFIFSILFIIFVNISKCLRFIIDSSSFILYFSFIYSFILSTPILFFAEIYKYDFRSLFYMIYLNLFYLLLVGSLYWKLL